MQVLFQYFILAFFFQIIQTQQTEKTTSNKAQCDFSTSNGICLYNGEKYLTNTAKPDGLVGNWNFDDEYPLDHSGYKNHAKNPIPPGPSFGGKGYSGNFNGYDFIEISNAPQYNSNSFSYSFWIYLLKDTSGNSKKGLRFCPIIQKGVDDSFEKVYFRSPAIYFDRKSNALKVMLTTTDIIEQPLGEVLISNAKLTYNRWNHITLSRQDKKVKLYVNGILDAFNATIGYSQPNTMPIFLGNTPWHKEDCNLPMLIDDFRIYNRGLKDYEIEAESSPQALGGIEPSFVQLGCINCPLKLAKESCIDGYHICTSIELHTGGYLVARIQGWISINSYVWSHSDVLKMQQNKSGNNEIGEGVGLCCQDLK